MTKLEVRAERAVKNFNRLVPTLESFAEALTGKRMPVKIGANTMTDGETIFIMPPITLGDEVVHQRKLCDRRDEDGTPSCPACERREAVLVNVYHEISHVAYDSFAMFDPDTFVSQLRREDVFTDEQADAIDGRIRRMGTTRRAEALSCVGAVSPFLPLLTGALEDVRVDTMMGEARVGTAVMRAAQRASVAANGYERLDGRVVDWADADLNSQFTVGMLYSAFGDEVPATFHPHVAETIGLPAVQALLKEASEARGVGEVALIATKAFALGQAFGFFISEDEDYNYNEQEEEDEASEEDEGSSGGDDEEGAGDSGPGIQPEGPGEDQSTDERPEQAEGDSSGDDSEAPGGDGGGDSPGEGRDDLGSEGSGGGNLPEEDDGGGSPGGPDAGPGGDANGELGGDEGDSDQGEQSDGSQGATSGSPGAGSAGTQGGELDAVPGERDAGELLGDEGTGGDTLERPEPEEFGDYRDVEEALEGALGHRLGEVGRTNTDDEIAEVLNAETRVEHLDERSDFIVRVDVRKKRSEFPNPARRASVEVAESILGPSLLKMRRALADNQRRKSIGNKRSGRVNSRVLGRRAWTDDDRLFTKRHAPGRRDYAVLIGVDVSGSTWQSAGGGMSLCDLQVRAAYAQAELCQRLGLKFAIYAHSGEGPWSGGAELLVYEVKTFDQPWTSKTKLKLSSLAPVQMNLDGHTLEYYRKRMDEVRATDKIIMYYSDGQMPAENYAEELRVLKREIDTCRKRGYTLLGVGAGTDAPSEHGMDTVRIDQVEDVPKVVEHLGKRVAATAL